MVLDAEIRIKKTGGVGIVAGWDRNQMMNSNRLSSGVD